MNPSSLRKYHRGRYVVAAVIIAVFAPIAGVVGWAFAGHAIWAAVAGALVGSLLGLQPVLQARNPALPDVVFARPQLRSTINPRDPRSVTRAPPAGAPAAS